jgi:hypothetical protein
VTFRESVIWLAGILEGEGCFISATTQHSTEIKLSMADLDVVGAAASLFGAPVHTGQKLKPTNKQQYVTYIHGARAAGWMMMLYPFMGLRRKEKIRACLTAHRTRAMRQIRPSCKNPSLGKGHSHCTDCERLARTRRLKRKTYGDESGNVALFAASTNG